MEAALRRAVALWGRLKPSEYRNGAIVFCSEGVAEAVHPLRPLQHRLYGCGRHFDTALLREQLEIVRSPAYGLIVIDGSDAVIGTAQGLGMAACRSTVSKLAHLQSNTASSTRRGGQSALRYARLREGEDLAFCRRVAERAGQLLGDVRGLVLAGKADTKRRLQPELPQHLRKKVLCMVDLPRGADMEGLRQAALRAGDAADSDRRGEAERAVRAFLEAVALPDEPEGVRCCYGEAQTAAALAMGAVEVLLVAAEPVGLARAKAHWRSLAEAHGAQVVEVEDRSEQGAHFCQAFRLGGRLRWAVDPDFLEEAAGCDSAATVPEEVPPEGVPPAAVDAAHAASRAGSSPHGAMPSSVAAEPAGGDPTGTEEVPAASPMAAGLPPELVGSIQSSLEQALGDASAAEALAVCVEVILSDDSASASEAASQAACMLLGEGVPREVVDEILDQVQ